MGGKEKGAACAKAKQSSPKNERKEEKPSECFRKDGKRIEPDREEMVRTTQFRSNQPTEVQTDSDSAKWSYRHWRYPRPEVANQPKKCSRCTNASNFCDQSVLREDHTTQISAISGLVHMGKTTRTRSLGSKERKTKNDLLPQQRRMKQQRITSATREPKPCLQIAAPGSAVQCPFESATLLLKSSRNYCAHHINDTWTQEKHLLYEQHHNLMTDGWDLTWWRIERLCLERYIEGKLWSQPNSSHKLLSPEYRTAYIWENIKKEQEKHFYALKTRNFLRVPLIRTSWNSDLWLYSQILNQRQITRPKSIKNSMHGLTCLQP